MPVLIFRSWVLNEICIIDLSSALFGMISSQLFLFSNEAHSRLLLELLCVTVIKHVAFFTTCAKLIMAFTFPSLLLNSHSSVSECDSGFGFEQKYGGSADLAKKGTARRICKLLLIPVMKNYADLQGCYPPKAKGLRWITPCEICTFSLFVYNREI